MKMIIAYCFVLFFSFATKAQYLTNSVSRENKFFFKNGSNVFFASYDENYINDSIISSYCIKDIRGMIVANVLFKVGKEIADTQVYNNHLFAYTEIIFTKNFERCQLKGFICAADVRNIFENLLYTLDSKIISKRFTYMFELDYNKTTTFCSSNPIMFTDKLEEVYNPVEDYYKLIEYFSKTKSCNTKWVLKPIVKLQPKLKKYIPKKI
jgi:hypothetical protein